MALTACLGPTLSAGASAQDLMTLGARPAALAAFVAVADDATAVAWNPAGLATGPFFNMVLDFGRSTAIPDRPFGARPADQAGRIGATIIALGVPPLGLSYYQLEVTALALTGPEGAGGPDRQDRQVAGRVLETRHLGATVLQSLGNHVSVGATVKLVRGHLGAGVRRVQSWDEGFERLEGLETRGSTTGDLDVGAMATAGSWRAGVVVRNVTQPTFELGRTGEAFSLARHVRAGVAWGDGWPGRARLLVAVDADLTRVRHPAGDRRDLAAGVERWLGNRRLGVRAGVRASTVDTARPIVSGGVSYAVRAGAYVDATVARGTEGDRAWGLAARVTY